MIVEGGKKYCVRLIPQTSNREDAIREIVGALDHLNAISDEIFLTIRTRLTSHRQQLESLSGRVSVATQQISSLKGSQRAIKILSPAKYPCENELSKNNVAFGHLTFPALVAKNIPSPPVLGQANFENEGMRCDKPLRFDTPIKQPNDLLSIFHVREPNLGDLTQLDFVTDVGLGKPPSSLQNADSFLLFNTIDNPYLNYKMTERSQDRHFGTLKTTRRGEEVHADVCPVVFQDHEGGMNQKTDIDDFYYNPSSMEIPTIDVPEHLPNLPGIAQNLDDADLYFSPPFSNPPKTLTLSNVPPQSFSNSNPQVPPLSILEESDDDFFAPHTSTPNEAPSSFETLNNILSVSKTVVSPPPPPPPPPPPVLIEAPKVDKHLTKPASSASGGDMRSSLMAAIREAGGSGSGKLKSAKDRIYEAKKKKQDEMEKNMTEELKEGGNLMADLKNTLAMRRRGISGIQDGQKRAGVGDIMQTLVASIPTLENSMEASGGINGSDDDEEDDWD